MYEWCNVQRNVVKILLPYIKCISVCVNGFGKNKSYRLSSPDINLINIALIQFVQVPIMLFESTLPARYVLYSVELDS